MQLKDLTSTIATAIAALPDEVRDSLTDVEILCCETPENALLELQEEFKEEPEALLDDNDKPLTIEADCKGLFIGEPLEPEMDADPDDVEDGELATGEMLDPEGFIVLCANNLANEEEASLVFLHEIGHALGMDEAEVAKLGLGVPPIAAPTTPTDKLPVPSVEPEA